MECKRGVVKYLLLVIFLIGSIKTQATHIRAAEMSAVRLSLTTYKFTLVLYTDKTSVEPIGTVTLDGKSAIISGTTVIPIVRVDTSSFYSNSYSTLKIVYEFEYSFSSTNTVFTVAFFENNRIFDIANINNSIDVPLYVKMIIYNEGCGGDDCQFNQTPVLLVPAVDQAVVGQVYTHNPGAWDANGDSLSYRLVPPKKNSIDDVDGYVSPGDPRFGGSSSISINPVTGDLVWDSPREAGKYNIAIEVTEWETSILGASKKSVIVRDMQIIVDVSDNKAPVVVAPLDTCVEAGKQFTSLFSGYDPNGDALTRYFYGGPFENNGAGFGPTYWSSAEKDQLDSIRFRWNPACDLVRNEPYQVVFKLSDDNIQPLSTLKSWNIQVQLPAPENVQVSEKNNDLRIAWDDYICKSTLDHFDLYRLSCDTNSFVPNVCTPGVLDEWGFDKIATIHKDSIGYLDQTVEVGGEYCYVLVAVDNKKYESLVSNMSCGNIGLDLPLLTNVTVDSTHKTAGEITVKWSKPLNLDTIQNPAPYKYELYRSNDVLGNNFGSTPIYTIEVPDFSTSKFEYTDDSLNTMDSPYSYKVDFYSDNINLGSSQTSSYIRLNAVGKFKRVELAIDSRVVWQFPDTLMQIVYRIVDSVAVPFDTLYGNPNGQAVYDLNNGEEYCLFIETHGVYCNAALVDSFLVNRTNTICVVPDDFNPPCPPQLSMDTLDCSTIETNSNLTTNTLTWKNNFKKEGCEDDIVKYTIYYQPTLESEFEEIEVFDSLTFDFRHYMENTRAGCYYITATDLKGLESEKSNVVCNDNCDTIAFPNIITPNADGKNDFFIPMPTPRNVKSIDFEVYNRLGKKVYSSVNNSRIEWNGKNYAGEELSDGMYYYSAIVTFYRLSTNDQQRVFNGWILLQR